MIIAAGGGFCGFKRPLEVIVNDIDGERFAELIEGAVFRAEVKGNGLNPVAADAQIICWAQTNALR